MATLTNEQRLNAMFSLYTDCQQNQLDRRTQLAKAKEDLETFLTNPEVVGHLLCRGTLDTILEEAKAGFERKANPDSDSTITFEEVKFVERSADAQVQMWYISGTAFSLTVPMYPSWTEEMNGGDVLVATQPEPRTLDPWRERFYRLHQATRNMKRADECYSQAHIGLIAEADRTGKSTNYICERLME